jgi:hypothetical protein
MATVQLNYDHPTYTGMRQETKSVAPAVAGSQAPLTFRSRVQCVVTGISAIIGGSLTPTTTLILTILHNNSVIAIVTVTKTINKALALATLTANRTLAAVTDSICVSTNAAVSADCVLSVIYEYKVLPGQDYTTFSAIA